MFIFSLSIFFFKTKQIFSHKGYGTITVRNSGLKLVRFYYYILYITFDSIVCLNDTINCLTSAFNNESLSEFRHLNCYCLLFKGKLFAPFWCIDLSSLLFSWRDSIIEPKKYSTVTLLWFSGGSNCFNMITNWRVTLNLPPLPWSAPVMLF